MLPNEQQIIEKMSTPFNRYFMPLAWATTIVARARKEGRIKDDFAVKTLIDVNNLLSIHFLSSSQYEGRAVDGEGEKNGAGWKGKEGQKIM